MVKTSFCSAQLTPIQYDKNGLLCGIKSA